MRRNSNVLKGKNPMKDLVSADVEVVEGPFNKLLRIKKPRKRAKNAFYGQHFAKKGTIFSKKNEIFCLDKEFVPPLRRQFLLLSLPCRRKPVQTFTFIPKHSRLEWMRINEHVDTSLMFSFPLICLLCLLSVVTKQLCSKSKKIITIIVVAIIIDFILIATDFYGCILGCMVTCCAPRVST